MGRGRQSEKLDRGNRPKYLLNRSITHYYYYYYYCLSVWQVDADSLSQLTADIRQFIHLYGSEHPLTGRAIARVLHGIDSPRFPATTWGRVRRFWRCQLHVHFHVVVREATAQLLLIR